ncbi:MAG: hypothetical protein ACQETL_15175 [Bacteroidota bacterium]
MSSSNIIIIFVEGDTEKVFYSELINYYRKTTSKKLNTVKIFNLKGIGRYESKVSSKVKHEVLVKYSPENVKVFCAYDTDVFELGKKPPTNWKLVDSKLKELGVDSMKTIKAERTIEDWFIYDLDGLIKFLKLSKTPNLKGKSGLEKMKLLFKRSNKIYQKGTYSHKFISYLNISKITQSLKKHLKSLEDELGC